uniref:Uncharacterized protein n=1 Tax=Arundo donax TaxID=35708 RepID=A0A0A8Y5L9_ARUDO
MFVSMHYPLRSEFDIKIRIRIWEMHYPIRSDLFSPLNILLQWR